MKNSLHRLIGMLILGMMSNSSLHAQVTISDPISVTQGDDSFGRKSPKLALNADGELMVFWMRTGNEAFYLSTLEAGGFSAPVQIPFGGLNPNLWSGSLGPNMASEGDDVYVTFEVYGDAIYVIHSDDAGQTWDAPVAAFTPPQGRRATIPTIAVDALGQPYIAYVNTDSTEGDAHYGMVQSGDFGASFSAEVEVSENANGTEVCECCNGHIDIADNGDIYVAFRNNNSDLRDIWLVRSTDGGATFDSAFDVDETDWTAGVCPSNGPHFALADNKVHTTFFSGAGASGSGVYYSTFDENWDEIGATIDIPATDSNSSNQNRPRIAGAGETIGLVWQENTNNSTDIAMSVSTSGPNGLDSEPLLLSSLISAQQFPSIVFDGERFHVVYEDNGSGTVLYQEVSLGGVGIKDEGFTDFSFSPNPSSEYVQISRPDAISSLLNIYDLQGRLVLSETIVSNRPIVDISELSRGQYSVILQTDSGISRAEKLIVQ